MSVVVVGKASTNYCYKICTSEFRKKCTLELRTVQAPNFGEKNATEVFSVYHTAYYKVNTLKGTRRFSGVNISKEATHLFTTLWRESLHQIDSSGEYFLNLYDIYYRVIEITNINEENRFIVFQATERGLDSDEESNA